MLPAEYPRHRPVPSTLCPCRAWFCRFWRPFFRGGEAAIHVALIPTELLSVVELVEEGPPEGQQHPTLLPLSEAAPAGGGAAVPRRQLAPRDLYRPAPLIGTSRPSCPSARRSWRS